jgi:cysteinyl-tRNA synthetase
MKKVTGNLKIICHICLSFTFILGLTTIACTGDSGSGSDKNTKPNSTDHVTINGLTQVNESSGAQFTLTAYYTDKSSKIVTSSGIWNENSSYASISSSGYLTTSSVSSNQSCTITASYGGKSDTYNVTIKNVPPTFENRDYRQGMRNFVQNISVNGKGMKPDFIVIPQNGVELLTENGEETGSPAINYLNAINGVGIEDLFYGYEDDDVATPVAERNYLIKFLDIAESNGIEILTTDYCWTTSFVDDSYEQNVDKGYISFAADHRELDNIPAYPATPYNVDASNITSLAEAKNFLYIINTAMFDTKSDFIDAVQNTDYDIVIIDLFYESIEELTSSEVEALKVKANSGTRLVIAYMSIGEAEDYRYYWQMEWETNPPSWLAEENPEWPGNYKVRYWDEDWQNIIYGSNDSYLKKIVDANFDGVYLDIIDAFEYFENQ